MNSLKSWLLAIRMEKYLEVLESNSVGLDILAQLTEADLADLGVTLGDRKRLIQAIKLEKNEQPHARDAGFREASLDFSTPQVQHTRPIGELRQMTLMLVDLVNSTGLVQELGIEKYRDTLEIFQNCVLAAIRGNFGYFSQFIGDGVVAYFGFPVANEDDAERAVLSALQVIKSINSIALAPGQPISVRVGIATGDVLVEDLMHGARTVDHFALGDIPNMAARLQGFAKPGEIAISGRTRRLLGGNFECRSIGEHKLKGFAEPIDIWLVERAYAAELRFDTRRQKSHAPMIGREAEFALLRSRWEAACRGESQAVFLSGEAGLGKSRLANELCERLVLPDAHRISFQCSPYHRNSAFYPIKFHLAHAIQLKESDTAEIRAEKLSAFLASPGGVPHDVAAVYTNLLSVGEPADADIGTPEEIKARTIEALLRYIKKSSEKKPILILFEDLHWVDPSSEELIDILIDRLNGMRVLLLGTYRPEYQARWRGKTQVTTLSLPGLGKQQTEELVAALANDQEILNGLRQAIVSRAGGVPLFVEEMVSMLARKSKSGLKSNRVTSELLLPSSLKDLLRARIDNLTVAPDTVSICAILGRSFSTELVAAVSRRDIGAVEAELTDLVQAEVLVPISSATDGGYSFRHALIRDVAYEAILPNRAARLHRRIAETMVRDFPNLSMRVPELLAQHYERAEMFEEARGKWQEAAAAALRNYASHEAIAHLTSALSIHERTGAGDMSDSIEIELRQQLSVALEIRAWGSPDIIVNLERLHELQSKVGDIRDEFSVLHQLCGTNLIGGRPDVAWDYCERLIELLGDTEDPVMRTLCEHNCGMTSLLLGEFDVAIEHFDRALKYREQASAKEISRYYPAEPKTIDTVMRCWAGALKQQDIAETHRELRHAIAVVEAEESEFSRCFAISILATVYCTIDDPTNCQIQAQKAHEISERIRFQYWEAWSKIVLGWAMARCGHAESGISTLRDGLERYAATGSAQILIFAKTLLADAYLSKKDLVEASALIEEAKVMLETSATGFHTHITQEVARKVLAQS